MTVTIITHDGRAHADEVFAAAILKLANPDGELNVIRTREPEVYKLMKGAPNVYFLDVGMEYDKERRLFDHHQEAGAGYRNEAEKRWPYATAGLVWRYAGYRAIQNMHPHLTYDERREVFRYVDNSLLKHIDAVDCGSKDVVLGGGVSISGMLSCFNPTSTDENQDVPFELMMELAMALLVNHTKHFVGKINARPEIRKSEKICDGRVLVLKKCLPWSRCVAMEMPDVLLAISPASHGRWKMRIATNQDDTDRIAVPAEWKGLADAELETKSGVKGAVFCHRSGYMVVASSYDSIVQMAKKVLQEHESKVYA